MGRTARVVGRRTRQRRSRATPASRARAASSSVATSPICAAIDAVKASQRTASLAPARPLKVYLGNIYGRNVEPLHWMAVDQIRSAAIQREHNVQVRFRPHWNDALLCRARSVTATAFLLDTDFDVHVSIDGDIEFEPWHLAQIARQAVTYDMVGGLYITRSRYEPRPTSIFDVGQTIVFGDDPTPQPVKWLASGFTATHRRVFERLAQDLPLCHEDKDYRFYPFYQPYWVPGVTSKWIYLSEDYALSDRASQAGFAPHVAPNIRLRHLGLHGHSLEDCLQKPLAEREIAITYQDDGRFKFEADDPDC